MEKAGAGVDAGGAAVEAPKSEADDEAETAGTPNDGAAAAELAEVVAKLKLNAADVDGCVGALPNRDTPDAAVEGLVSKRIGADAAAVEAPNPTEAPG